MITRSKTRKSQQQNQGQQDQEQKNQKQPLQQQTEQQGQPKRGRGRPRKNFNTKPRPLQGKRSRGRPRKASHQIEEEHSQQLRHRLQRPLSRQQQQQAILSGDQDESPLRVLATVSAIRYQQEIEESFGNNLNSLSLLALVSSVMQNRFKKRKVWELEGMIFFSLFIIYLNLKKN